MLNYAIIEHKKNVVTELEKIMRPRLEEDADIGYGDRKIGDMRAARKTHFEVSSYENLAGFIEEVGKIAVVTACRELQAAEHGETDQSISSINNSQIVPSDARLYKLKVPGKIIDRSLAARQEAEKRLSEYEKAVPESLRVRTADAHTKLAKAKKTILDKLDGGTFGAMIDLDTAETCNLDAVAIRRSLLKKQDPALAQVENRYYPNDSSEFNELVYREGRFTVVNYAGERRRIVEPISSLKDDMYLCFWYDMPVEKTRWLKRKVNVDDPSVLSELPLTVGISTVYGVIPLLSSIKTSTGCNVVRPDDEEFASENFNKPDLLALVSDLIDRPSITSLNTLLIMLSDSVVGDMAYREAVALTSRLMGRDMNVSQLLQSIEGMAVKESVRTDPDNSKKTDLNVIAKYKTTVVVKENDRPKSACLRLCFNEVLDKTGLASLSLTIYSGLDQDKYGDVVVAYPKFLLTNDGVNEPTIAAYDLGGNITIATSEQLVEFEALLGPLLGELRQGMEHIKDTIIVG